MTDQITKLIDELNEFLAQPARARDCFKLDYAQVDSVHKALIKLNTIKNWTDETVHGFAAAEIKHILEN